jgi:alpha-tubulin suppressor-like RCC1 family protein
VGAAVAAGALHSRLSSARSEAAPSELLQQRPSSTPSLFCWGRLAPASAGMDHVPHKVRTPIEVDFWSSRGLCVKQISYGTTHGAAIDDKGGLWAWGTACGPLPKRVPCSANITSLASTSDALYAVTNRGRVLEWRNLGVHMASDAPPTAEPKPLGGALSRVSAASVAAGNGHVLVVGSRGEVVSFGDNERGQCGIGSEEPACSEPVLLKTLPAGAKAAMAACGGAHSLVLLKDGSVLAFGDDRNIQLGVRARTVKAMREGPSCVRVPQRVQQLPYDRPVVAVAAGGGGLEGGHSAFLVRGDDGDEVWVCGHGRWGQLGVRSFAHQSEPRRLSELFKLREWDEASKRVVGVRVSQLACGDRHTAALLATGNVFTWGWNDHGQLGSGNGQGTHTPTLVNAPPELRFTELHGISCGPNSVAAWT